MDRIKLVLTWIFALLLITAGINHVINPKMYTPFIPDWLPLIATNYFTAIVEAGLGLGLIFTFSRRAAAIGTTLLMVFFLPFHFVDAFRAHPAIGSILLAIVRLPLQFVLIYWAWFIVPNPRTW